MEKTTPAVVLDIGSREARLQRLSAGAEAEPAIRLSARQKGGKRDEVLTLSENQLIELLHRASHAGVLSQGFFGKLREKIEI